MEDRFIGSTGYINENCVMRQALIDWFVLENEHVNIANMLLVDDMPMDDPRKHPAVGKFSREALTWIQSHRSLMKQSRIRKEEIAWKATDPLRLRCQTQLSCSFLSRWPVNCVKIKYIGQERSLVNITRVMSLRDIDKNEQRATTSSIHSPTSREIPMRGIWLGRARFSSFRRRRRRSFDDHFL